MNLLAGLDIGGTKCAVVLGVEDRNQHVEVIARRSFPTPDSPGLAIDRMMQNLEDMIAARNDLNLLSIGISCGGPLDSRKGLILSPPNLPNWDRIDMITPLQERFHVPAAIQNDANACALAEWKWGAGKGYKNLIFLTFGTGMGAGLILDGRLYSGTNDMAGEVGHIRLEDEGPEGFGKAGSFEGFCSGGGIARFAQYKVKQHLTQGESTSLCGDITAKSVAEAALAGDDLACEIFEVVGQKLGKGLAILLDILNPERVIIGSIYSRQEDLLKPTMLKELKKEALSHAYQVCTIVPSGLGEKVGDLASLSVAKHALDNIPNKKGEGHV
ncbi:glucokinase [Scopulibacillus darangshiensis]|uniref:Glucokinase n=1 Tax=Scopulibacillus darangshiensis TaxID=442528 RepID=A0A4R2P489_9BACL|nr:ROK family protein [Scopulibacillus darangshiensis]TCP29457.1 glucokinase [Scopulibacillus darangshiensis]